MRHVIGTAGHVDHGKSSLVRALTGTDPDRLAEERRRGMSIELGFAEWRLPSGAGCGIVDVPGHQRFVATMVAGAAGIDLALLVVAADEGVMPQTREHLAICELLGVRGLVVVLSRSDLADPDTAELAHGEVAGLLEGGRFGGAPAVTCSSTTGEGLETLAQTVDAALAELPPRRDRGRPRLFVDRAFSLPGFGPVVTGTLEGGSLREGDVVQLLPGGLRARVRGLQRHGEQVGTAEPGARTAVNLTGVERRALARGMALVHPETLATSRRIDVWLRCTESAPAPIRHGSLLDLHLGTAETRARIWLLEGAELEPGAEGAAQLTAERPLVAAPGDRLVVRRPSPAATLGGGEVLDVSPRRHRRNHAGTADALRRRRGAGPAALVAEELDKHRAGVTRRQLTLATGCAGAELDGALRALGERAVGLGDRVFSTTRASALREQALSVLEMEHAADPLRRGIQREQWRERLRITEAVCIDLVRRLAAEGEVEEDAGLVARRGRGDHLPAREREAVEAVMAALERRGLDAASLSDLAPVGMTPAVLRHLVERRRAVRIGNDLVLAASSCEQARQQVVRHLEVNGAATVSELRDLLGITRRTAVPLLEHLDRGGVTRRDGDVRRLRPVRGHGT